MQGDEITRLIAEVERLRAQVERVTSDREYIIGFNAGWSEAVAQNLQFPTMLRKMWSGSEVQRWIDDAMAAARSALSVPVQALEGRERPINCRNRLRAEGKPYPRSGCSVCRTGGLTGCPYERAAPPSTPSKEG